MSHSAVSPPRVLGVAAVAFSSFNCIVGAGIFGLPALAAAALGPAAVIGYLISTLLLALVALCLAEAGSRVSEAGGTFAYASASFGPVVGGIVGTLTWTSCMTASGAVANLWVGTLATAWPLLGSGVPRAATLIGTYALLAAVNVRGARQGAWLSVALAIVKLVPLVALVLVGIFAVHPENLHWTRMPAPGALGSATVLLFFAFVGVEGGLYNSAEVRDASRTIPRAIFIAAFIVAALYMGLQFVAQGILGPLLPNAASPLVNVAQVLFGPWGSRLMIAAILAATFGYLVADVLTAPRPIYALATQGQLPRAFAALHPRSGTPAVAIYVYQALCALLAISGSFRPLAVFTSAATLIIYGICCLGLLRLRSRNIEQSGPPFRVPGGALVPLAATALIGWLLSSLTREELMATLIPTVLAGIAYAAQGRIHRRTAAEAAIELDPAVQR